MESSSREGYNCVRIRVSRYLGKFELGSKVVTVKGMQRMPRTKRWSDGLFDAVAKCFVDRRGDSFFRFFLENFLKIYFLKILQNETLNGI